MWTCAVTDPTPITVLRITEKCKSDIINNIHHKIVSLKTPLVITLRLHIFLLLFLKGKHDHQNIYTVTDYLTVFINKKIIASSITEIYQ